METLLALLIALQLPVELAIDYSIGATMANTASSYLGVPYRWGGESRRGLDCSGLTRAVALEYGIDLPHKAAWQFQQGQHVAKQHVMPGDFVFFSKTAAGFAIVHAARNCAGAAGSFPGDVQAIDGLGRLPIDAAARSSARGTTCGRDCFSPCDVDPPYSRGASVNSRLRLAKHVMARPRGEQTGSP